MWTTNNKLRALSLTTVLLASACAANDTVLRSGRETPDVTKIAPVRPTFEADLDAMRTASFQYIFVLRRKDGGALDAADRDLIRANTAQANRRVSSDGGRAFLIGSNFQIPLPNIKPLYVHFSVENFAADPLAMNANTNTNTNK